jgi:hypothetical protein
VGRVIPDLATLHSPLAGGDDDGMNPIDVRDTRPGGLNRQERAHRVGAPESLAEAIEEIGMVQVHTCVSVHCDQCRGSLGSPGFEAHYGGCRVGRGGRGGLVGRSGWAVVVFRVRAGADV